MTMMKTLIVRDEPQTQVNMHGYPYWFKTNDNGDKVCDVLNAEHVHMMEQSGNFVRYVGPGEKRDDFDEAGFVRQWEKLPGPKFAGRFEDVIERPDEPASRVFHEGFVHRHLDSFYKMGKANRKKAIDKWNLASGGRIWPGRPIL